MQFDTEAEAGAEKLTNYCHHSRKKALELFSPHLVISFKVKSSRVDKKVFPEFFFSFLCCKEEIALFSKDFSCIRIVRNLG